MKFKLNFHLDFDGEDPEGVIEEAVQAAHERAKYEMTEREYNDLCEKQASLVWEALGKFLRDECCLEVEFDIKSGTAVAVGRTQ